MNILGTIGSAIGGINPLIGYGLLSGIGGLASSMYGAEKSQKQSKELMDYQYKLQQEAIDKQNLYNSPAEQMKRLASAGLSPNLVYGNGVDGNQSSAASPSIANRRVDMSNPFQDLGQAYLQSKELDLAQIKTRNEAFESRSRTKLNEAKTLSELSNAEYLKGTLRTRIDAAKQKLLNDVTKGNMMTQQTNNLQIMANNLVEQTKLLHERTNLTIEQARTEVTKQMLNRAKIYLTNAQTKEVGAMIEFIQKGSKLRDLGYKVQNSAFDATKIYQDWKKEHPNTTLTLDIVKDVVGIGKDIGATVGNFIP